MNDDSPKHQNTIEIIEENPGAFTWRIVNRDRDTHQEIGAPISGISLYATEREARASAEEALIKLEGGSYVPPSPRANG